MHWFWRLLIANMAGVLVTFFAMFIVTPLFDMLTVWIGGSAAEAIILCFLGGVVSSVAIFVYVRLPKRFDWLDETRCRKCGYILRGITEPRCSECGERI